MIALVVSSYSHVVCGDFPSNLVDIMHALIVMLPPVSCVDISLQSHRCASR